MIKDLKALRFSNGGDLYKVNDETARKAISELNKDAALIVSSLPSLSDGKMGIIYFVENNGSYTQYVKVVENHIVKNDAPVTDRIVDEEVYEVFDNSPEATLSYNDNEYVEISGVYYNITGSVELDEENGQYKYSGSLYSETNNAEYSWKLVGNEAPIAQANSFGLVKADGVTITNTNGTLSAVPQVTFKMEVVNTLPTTGEELTIYLVSNEKETGDVYDEYLYVNNNWEKIGNTTVDLSSYVTTSALNTALANKANASDLEGLADDLEGEIDSVRELVDTKITQVSGMITSVSTDASAAAAQGEMNAQAISDLVGSLADVATSGSYDDLTDKPSVIVNEPSDTVVVNKIRSLTRAEYDDLETIDTNTVYYISDEVAGGGSDYELPVASTDTLGGVKVDGETITVNENGVISAAGGSDITLVVKGVI